LILTSRTYRMASTPDERNAAIDPDNAYLWRMPSRRMEAELVRDNLLFVSNALDATMGGPEIDHKQGLSSKRRSVYLRIAAEKEVEFLKLFDGPSITECYERRPSVVPQQALALANSGLALDLREAFLRILARPPKAAELRHCLEFLTGLEKGRGGTRTAKANLILVLFNHNDFLTIR
jgi:hypothetical protein